MIKTSLYSNIILHLIPQKIYQQKPPPPPVFYPLTPLPSKRSKILLILELNHRKRNTITVTIAVTITNLIILNLKLFQTKQGNNWTIYCTNLSPSLHKVLFCSKLCIQDRSTVYVYYEQILFLCFISFYFHTSSCFIFLQLT